MKTRIAIWVFFFHTLIIGCGQKMSQPPDSDQWMRALLASRFSSLEDFESAIQVQHIVPDSAAGDTFPDDSRVELTYKADGKELVCALHSGLRQRDLVKAVDSGFWYRVGLLFESPLAVSNRVDLNKIYKLSRRRPSYFGEGDVAFYDLALESVKNINTPQLAYLTERDSSEKGYINTFNHVTAQAFITTFFSEEVAEFIADMHERENMPELISGLFKESQLTDPDNNPVDNYVDIINNKLGQDLGTRLKKKYQITEETIWTPKLLSDYLNDMQDFYAWSFNIGFTPYHETDELVMRFCEKIAVVSKGVPYRDENGKI
ncbi:MAG: hypothetical protein GC181_13880 [Bacteroidetes bacterium]|nr:hypothetical protein [Bacteroidota bacterium]